MRRRYRYNDGIPQEGAMPRLTQPRWHRLICAVIDHEYQPATFDAWSDQAGEIVTRPDPLRRRCAICGVIPEDIDRTPAAAQAGLRTLIGPEFHAAGEWGDRRIKRAGPLYDRIDFDDLPAEDRRR